MAIDDGVLKKVESALEVAKFAPKRNEQEQSVDLVLEELQDIINGLQKAHDQMKTAWDAVAKHAMGITNRITK